MFATLTLGFYVGMIRNVFKIRKENKQAAIIKVILLDNDLYERGE